VIQDAAPHDAAADHDDLVPITHETNRPSCEVDGTVGV